MWALVLAQTEPWTDFVARVTELGRGAETGALSFLAAAVVAVVGWWIALLLSRLVRALLRALRFNAGIGRLLGASVAARHEPAGVAAWAIQWLIVIFALVLAVEMLGVDIRASVGQRMSDVLPRVVTAAVLFAVGTLIAMLLGALFRRFLETAGLRGARLWGQVLTVVLTGFAVLVALEQLGFAAQFVMILGIVGVGVAGLGLALAFGLGCRDLARDFVVEYLRSLDEERPKRPD